MLMEEKVFIAPKLIGSGFIDHSLPVNILEDFTALQDLLIEVSSAAFKPTLKDDYQLSVYNGGKYTAKTAFEYYTQNYAAFGVLSVSVQ